MRGDSDVWASPWASQKSFKFDSQLSSQFLPQGTRDLALALVHVHLLLGREGGWVRGTLDLPPQRAERTLLGSTTFLWGAMA